MAKGRREDFFNSRETGGTVVSSALELMNEIIPNATQPGLEHLCGTGLRRRQLGRRFAHCRELLVNQILPLVQYYAYVEIAARDPQACGTPMSR